MSARRTVRALFNCLHLCDYLVSDIVALDQAQLSEAFDGVFHRVTPKDLVMICICPGLALPIALVGNSTRSISRYASLYQL